MQTLIHNARAMAIGATANINGDCLADNHIAWLDSKIVEASKEYKALAANDPRREALRQAGLKLVRDRDAAIARRLGR